MNKKSLVITIVLSILCLSFLYFFSGFTGFAMYSSNTAACGVDMSDDSTFEIDQDCGNNLLDGLNINFINIKLDCKGNSLLGSGMSQYGIKISADNFRLFRCKLDTSVYNLDVYNSGSEIVDSNIITGSTKNIRLASGKNATIINTSYELDGSVTVGAGSKLFVKNYARVRVVNSSGSVIGATVSIGKLGTGKLCQSCL